MGVLKIEEKELAWYIREISSGHEKVLEQFYETYGRFLLVLILSFVKTKECAEEVLQDVLMAIVTHKPDQPIINAKAWLLRVIQNIAQKKRREDQPMPTEPLDE